MIATIAVTFMLVCATGLLLCIVERYNTGIAIGICDTLILAVSIKCGWLIVGTIAGITSLLMLLLAYLFGEEQR